MVKIRQLENVIKNNIKYPYELVGIFIVTGIGNFYRALIKNKNDVCAIEYSLDIMYDDKSSKCRIYPEEKVLININDVFKEDIYHKLSKMYQITYDFLFIYSYCFGTPSELKPFVHIKNLIDKFYYAGPRCIIHIKLPDIRIVIFHEICLESMQINHRLSIGIEEEAALEYKLSRKYSESFQDITELKLKILSQWAAKPLNKQVDELKMEDYKLLHMINY